jgi:hypothetical protein
LSFRWPQLCYRGVLIWTVRLASWCASPERAAPLGRGAARQPAFLLPGSAFARALGAALVAVTLEDVPVARKERAWSDELVSVLVEGETEPGGATVRGVREPGDDRVAVAPLGGSRSWWTMPPQPAAMTWIEPMLVVLPAVGEQPRGKHGEGNAAPRETQESVQLCVIDSLLDEPLLNPLGPCWNPERIRGVSVYGMITWLLSNAQSLSGGFLRVTYRQDRVTSSS